MHIKQVSMFLDFLDPPKLNPKANVKLKAQIIHCEEKS